MKIHPIAPDCGLDVALAVMGGKWKPLILFHLQSGPMRFAQLRRQVPGISEKVLIGQLRELERDGILTRRDYQQIPPKVDYTLSEVGLSLIGALMPLCEWGLQNRVRFSRTLTGKGNASR